jgi:secreted Zn-dependent insulinase-like peptidase
LKKENLAVELSAGVSSGCSIDENTMYNLFSLEIQLTEKGLANWVIVVKFVNQYLNLLLEKGIEKRIYDEIQQISNISFGLYLSDEILVIFFDWNGKNDLDFMDEQQPDDLAERLSIEMMPYLKRDR